MPAQGKADGLAVGDALGKLQKTQLWHPADNLKIFCPAEFA